MTSSSPFAPIRRVVVGHNSIGLAAKVRDDYLPLNPSPAGLNIRQIWASDEYPACVSSEDDKATLNMGLNPIGSSFNIVDIPPRSTGIMHRSITLDYGVVIEGSVVLILDDGSRTVLGPGDAVIVQAGMHRWDNESDQWARKLGILLPAKAPVVNGKELQEDVSF